MFNQYNELFIILLVVFFLSASAIILGVIYLVKISNKKSLHIKRVTKRDFFYRSYKILSQFILTKTYLKNIKKRIDIVEIGDDRSNSRKAMKFAYLSMMVALLAFLLLSALIDDFYYLIISLLTVFIIHEQVQTILFDKLDNNLLIQFERFLTTVRHHYHEHHMIDEAIYDSVEESSFEISLHANKMYEILTATDIESEIEEYYEVVPNKFFKTFLALCYLVMQFGDQVMDNNSIFLLNLNYLKQEINFEILKQNRMNHIFKSLSVITIIPVFLLKPISLWAITNIPEMKSYYEGTYGFIVELIMFVLVLVSFIMIEQMRRKKEIVLKSYWLENLFLKIPKMPEIVDRITMRNYTKAKRLSEVIRSAEIGMNMRIFFSRKVLLFIIGSFISLLVFYNIHAIKKEQLMDNINYVHKDILEGKIDKKTLDEMDQIILTNHEVYNKNEDELRSIVKETFPTASENFIHYYQSELQDRISQLSKSRYKWWEIIICFGVALLFYQFPNIVVHYKKKLMIMELEDEVMQFHTIILMLMYIEQITVEDLVRWMEQFSFMFKSDLGQCLNNMEYGDIEALEQLKTEVTYIPFVRIIDNLILASDKIPIRQAFDELRIERNYYLDKRKQDNEILLNKKETLGKLIAFIPLSSLILLYLLLPFLFFTVNQLFDFQNQVKEFL